MLNCALSGPLHLYQPIHFGKELEWLKDRYWSDQDPPELHLAPWKQTESTVTFDVMFQLKDVLELKNITFQSYLSERWQCLIMPGMNGLDGFLNTVFGHKDIKDSHSHYALLLECLEDKEEVMEEGLENPFIERTKYPLPTQSYILLYAETDHNGNDSIRAQLYQSRFDDDSTKILSNLYYPIMMATNSTNSGINYLEALGCMLADDQNEEDILTTTNGDRQEWKWDVLAARDQDIMEKERLRQLQRPDFFAKPRPKPVPKKRNTIDLKFLLERQEAGGNTTTTSATYSHTTSTTTGSPISKGKRKELASSSTTSEQMRKSPEQARKKKTTAVDSWESENKDMIKKRLWGTMSKKRGHDRRSEKSKLLYHQIYQSCQYVFRRTMKDEQVNSKLLDQVIDKHLEFYEDLDKSF